MIIEWILSLCSTLLDWFLSLFGTADPPAFIGQAGDTLATLVNGAYGLGAWVPWTVCAPIALGVFSYWLVVVGIKGVRWLWGLTPFSGGS